MIWILDFRYPLRGVPQNFWKIIFGDFNFFFYFSQGFISVTKWLFLNLDKKIYFRPVLALFKPYFSPQTPQKMGFSRIIVFLASRTTFLTQSHGFWHRRKANGPQSYILHILWAEKLIKPMKTHFKTHKIGPKIGFCYNFKLLYTDFGPRHMDLGVRWWQPVQVVNSSTVCMNKTHENPWKPMKTYHNTHKIGAKIGF